MIFLHYGARFITLEGRVTGRRDMVKGPLAASSSHTRVVALIFVPVIRSFLVTIQHPPSFLVGLVVGVCW